MGIWEPERGTNLLDTGAHFYDVYETSDGKYVSIGSIEPQFYAELLRLTGLDADETMPKQMDRSRVARPQGALRGAVQDEDPRRVVRDHGAHRRVLRPGALASTEAPQHPHNVERGTFVERNGVVQPAPAPRFSRTAAEIQRPPSFAGQHTDEALADWGVDAATIAKLRETGAVK